MKSVASGLILFVISWALFLAFMGSSDPVAKRVPTPNAAIPLSFVYGVCAYGLRNYRRRNGIAVFVGFLAACIGGTLNAYWWFFPSALSLDNAGRTLFAIAATVNVVAFLIPWKVSDAQLPNQHLSTTDQVKSGDGEASGQR
jgi:hypothetical protein